jgi:hypothetical protein
VNFFLADGTIEVKEINETNNGRQPFPMLLKKQKLANQPILTHCPGMSLKKEEYYATQDLVIGNRVNIFGRDCLIYDADEFTMQWYVAAYGLQMVPIQLKKLRPNLIY